jgi:integrase
MSEGIKVSVYKYPDRKNLLLGYDDPTTGKRVTKSAKTSDETAAERAAGVWQDELNSGRYQAPNRVTWAEFRARYEAEKLVGLALGTQKTTGECLDRFERVINPDRLAKVTAAVLSRFQTELRKPHEITRGKKKILKPGLKDTSIARYLRHLKAALRWGAKVGLLAKAPEIEMPRARGQGQSLARSRPITTEEYERLLTEVPKVRSGDAPEWKRFITLLWLSGLRRGEAVALSWDQDAPFCVDLTRKVFRIYGESQKSGKDELVPLVPDLVEWLEETPEAERHGMVVNLIDQQTRKPLPPEQVGKVVRKIGSSAKVVTNKAAGKYAGCHDLRRSFGTRWAKLVMPAILRRLMRHAAIQTTLAYYVDLDAAEVARELSAKFGVAKGNSPAQGNILGNSGPLTAGTVVDGPDVKYNQNGSCDPLPL